MIQFTDRPIPMINPQSCDGCGLCVHACPTRALGLQDDKAFVAKPLACEYNGMCEAICPVHAISRPFEIIVVTSADGGEDRKSTKVVEKD
jgi:MinD superfamily P-loop ATPase